MWTSYEIEKVQEMYGNLEKETIEDILPSELINVIQQESDKSYPNLRFVKNTIFTFLQFFQF